MRKLAPYSWRVGNTTLLVDGHQPIYLSVTEDDNIGKSLFWDGLSGWETETLTVFTKLVQQSRLFLDIGSNSGIYSLLAARIKPEVRCIAFEPIPEVFKLLRQNIDRNGFSKTIEARQQAVGEAAGSSSFHVSEDPTMSSLNPNGYRSRQGRVITVDVIIGDQLLREDTNIQPDLIKIDVESFEDVVLRGMSQILLQHQPVLLLECNSDGPADAIESILGPLRYQFFHLTPEGPKLREHIVPDPTDHLRNWLMMPVGKLLPT